MLQLQGTSACIMRDELVKARKAKKITLQGITDKLCLLDIPNWLQSQILQMVSHRKNERITCPVELAMEKAVSYKILQDILKTNEA